MVTGLDVEGHEFFIEIRVSGISSSNLQIWASDYETVRV
jgi:hypothetical protein